MKSTENMEVIMNYKKIIALTAIISALALGGCSSKQESADSSAASEPSVISEMTDSSVTETKTETEAPAETSAETEASSAEETSEAKPSGGNTAEEAYSAKNGASWTNEIMTSATEWDKGNVVFCYSMQEEDMFTSVEMSLYNSKVYMNTEISGFMTMTMIIDGDKCYLIDKPSKSYCIDTENEYNADSEVESIVDTTADYSSFSEDGIENIDGTDYIFEKYIADGSECVFYYTPEGKLEKMGTDGIICDFSIELMNEPDESVFIIPEDYTEVSSEEMTMLMMGGLFEAMGELTEEGISEAE